MEEEIKKNSEGEDRRIVDVIKRKKMHMRPRWYFVLRAVIVIVCTAVLFLLLLYVVSFMIFALHENGVWFAADYGPSGWTLFLLALPWGMFILSLVLLVLLANLLKRYSFIYHQPLFYFLFAFILVVTIAGFAVAATSFHPGLFQYAARNIPFLGSFYERETAFPATVHKGEIVAFADNGLVIDDGLGITSTVMAAAGVVFISNFHIGDTVLVFGTRLSDGTIRAFGIQRIAVATSTGTVVLPAPAQ